MDHMRKHLSDILLDAMLRHGGVDRLVAETGLPDAIIRRAVTSGVVDAVDLLHITRALDLDAGAVLAEAANQQSTRPNYKEALNHLHLQMFPEAMPLYRETSPRPCTDANQPSTDTTQTS